MRYKILVFGIIFIASILVLMEVDRGIQAKILGVSDYIKTFFLNTGESIADTYNRHFDQAAQIESLNQKLQDYDKLSLENQNLKNELVKYQKIVGQDGFIHGLSDFHLARIISFATLGEKDRVWLDTNLSNYRKSEALEDRIFGIVKDNAALGVAVVQNGRVEGFLNGNANCNYDVYIGQNRVMGIVSGSSGGNLLVDYIPWTEIHKGDRVFTSGLDGIFLENIPVGVVENVRENYGYLSVEVKPYASLGELSYVWIIDRETPQLHLLQDEIHSNQPQDSQKEPQENIESNM
ncbi:rod shape-determining protein [Helicobacter cinaedi CCUG 18818 = ATCC BAA-847]|uniref:Cell shape-determining protein MreC n=2 Tax=Helicobacter cinaedi CCUG 18818 = ATCC BAA-847 TaxID=537971 RepID=A0AAI8QI66_9HELI|nr:rod shape-determining protein MreC [Helicobacter cinaedi]BAM33540.1 rod shape-determining protein [Helicobacter cinaedi CCUG 18818 = ATCC BAA-847]